MESNLIFGWRGLDAANRSLRILHESIENEGNVDRRPAAIARQWSLLDWGRAYLPDHFRVAPSRMHVWLAEQFDEMKNHRGRKLNVLGPRGGAKSTIATLAFVLRSALEGREPYIWIISDTKHQAIAHLENVKAELRDNPLIAADYPEAAAAGRRWRENLIGLANGVTIEAFGTGQRIRGRRSREHRPTLIVCDDLQDDRHIESRLAARTFGPLVSRKVAEGGNEANERGESGHRPASRGAGPGSRRDARLDFAAVRGHRALARQYAAVGRVGADLCRR